MSTAQPSARSTSSSRASGRTEDRHDGVADEFLQHPAVSVDGVAHPVEVARHDRSQDLRIQRLPERSEAGHVGEHDADDLALLDRPRCGWAVPQSDRSARPVEGRPHATQGTRRSRPQLRQKRASPPLTAPHDGHSMRTS